MEKLTTRHLNLLRKVVENQEMEFASCGKLLTYLENLGLLFVYASPNKSFGNKNVIVKSSIFGEEFIDEIDKI